MPDDLRQSRRETDCPGSAVEAPGPTGGTRCGRRVVAGRGGGSLRDLPPRVRIFATGQRPPSEACLGSGEELSENLRVDSLRCPRLGDLPLPRHERTQRERDEREAPEVVPDPEVLPVLREEEPFGVDEEGDGGSPPETPVGPRGTSQQDEGGDEDQEVREGAGDADDVEPARPAGSAVWKQGVHRDPEGLPARQAIRKSDPVLDHPKEPGEPVGEPADGEEENAHGDSNPIEGSLERSRTWKGSARGGEVTAPPAPPPARARASLAVP